MPVDHVLTEASTMTCSHPPPLPDPPAPPPPVPPPPIGGGSTLSIDGVGALRVSGKPVLPFAVLATVAGACTVPSPPGTPCAGAAPVTGGAATKLRVNSVPVLLAGTFAATPPTASPPPTYQVVPNQTKLMAE